MQNLRARMPPVNSLIAFEASSRLLSFTRAAEELTVSREAVSRHIRILETHLGVRLFQRMHRAIALTREGEAFAEVVRQSLEEIAEKADTLRGADQRPRVVVSATIAISSFWLTPRLPGFRAENPDLEIRVMSSDMPVPAIGDEFDVALRYGDGRWPGHDADHLFKVDTMPVCSPDYLQARGPIASPAGLVDHTLLNLDGATHTGENWRWWLENHGISRETRLDVLGFDSYANVIQSALDGQGIALGFRGIIGELLARGRLVEVGVPALSRGKSVYLLTPQKRKPRPEVQTFRNWVLSEARRQTGL